MGAKLSTMNCSTVYSPLSCGILPNMIKVIKLSPHFDMTVSIFMIPQHICATLYLSLYLSISLSFSKPAYIVSMRSNIWGMISLAHSRFQETTSLRPLKCHLVICTMCLSLLSLFLRPLQLFYPLCPPILPQTSVLSDPTTNFFNL